jgi:hypothetical protein
MAISDTSKIDLLYKKLFGVAKTDTATNKGLGNESIASPSLIRGDKVWSQSGSIPATAAAVGGIVEAYQTTARVECTAITSAVPISSVYPSWNTNLADWISPEFGSDYFVKVYADTAGAVNPASTGTQLSDSGSGSIGEWYFDYQSGVLNFIGGTIPAALTAAKVIFVTGYRYIGATGVLYGASVANTAILASVSLLSNVANTVLTLNNFTTANLAEGTNLYFTNARVVSALIAGDYITIEANGRISANVNVTSSSVSSSNSNVSAFAYLANVANTVLTLNNFTTANLAEGVNLYYTNARVISAINPLLTAANIVNFDSKVIADVTPLLTTANVVETTNQYFTNVRVLQAVNPLLTAANIVNFNSNVVTVVNPLLTTANIVETTNQYFTNVRVLQAVNPVLTTANIVETSNQYFTNVRVLQAVNPLLTTSNVIEGTNLYFTNARVLANVEQMSINVFADVDLTGIQTTGILQWNGTKFISGTVSAATSSNTALFALLSDFANVSSIANIANTVLTISNFSTANLAEGINLYYTNARVISAINPLLTTANVVETTNQYFTNARAAIALTGQDVSLKDLYVAGNLRVQGDFTYLNVAALDIEDKNITIANAATTSAEADGAGITIRGADATLTYKVVGDKFEVNKNFTVNGAITANTWTGLYTSNVIENTNQFFTNTRVIQAVTPLLTTANVTELTNLYFTTARVLANVEQMSVNVFADVDISGITSGGYLEWNGTKFIPGTLANKLTTANVLELTNLYFTNARAVAAIQNVDATLGNLRTTGLLTVSSSNQLESVSGIEFANNPAGGTGDSAKLQFYAINFGVNDDTVFELSTSNNPGDSINFKTAGGGVGINRDRPTADFDVNGNVLVERNLIIDGTTFGQIARFNSLRGNSLIINGQVIISSDGNLANITVSKITANTWGGLYTANVIESDGYFYFTNARLQPFLTTANVTELTNQYFTNVRVLQAVNPLLTTANVVETTNQYFTNARVFANVEQMSVNVFADVDITGIQNNGTLIWNGTKFVAGVSNSERANVANTVLSISNFTTSDLREGSNLYFTSTRTVNTVTPLLTTANVVETTNQYFTNVRVLQVVNPLLTTANVAELTNQYFTNTRVVQAVTPLLTTANVVETTNLYFTNARVVSALIAGQHIIIESNGRISANVTSISLTTDQVSEGVNNKYFTNARVLVGITTGTVVGNITATGKVTADTIAANSINVGSGSGGSITDANLISATYIQANIWLGLYTANIVESPTNLFFTTARVNATVQPFLTTANVIESAGNLYFTNARVLANVEQMSINVFADVDITGIANEGILQWNGTKFISGSIAQSQSSNTSLFAFFANVANTVLTLNNFTTANLSEGVNQYFTNTRVAQAVTGITLSNLTLSGNIVSRGIVTSTIISDRITSNILVINNSLTSSVKIANIVSPDPTLITMFSANAYRTAEFMYTVIGKDAHAKYNSGKILVLHDNVNVYFNQYGILLTGDGEELVTFSADINNSNVRLFATVTAADIVCDIRIASTTYTEN